MHFSLHLSSLYFSQYKTHKSMAAQLSNSEAQAIAQSILLDTRSDGRSRIQHRPVVVKSNVIPRACGSSVVVLGGTASTAVDTSSTHQDTAASRNSKAAEKDEDEDDVTGFENHAAGQRVLAAFGADSASRNTTKVLASVSAEVIQVSEDAPPSALEFGSMEAHLDCVPSVVAMYSRFYQDSRGGMNSRGLLLTHLTTTLSKLLGAKVTLSGASALSSGGADAADGDVVADDAANAGDEVEGASMSAARSGPSGPRVSPIFYSDLYIGHGYAFHLHVDVHILQGGGGNLLAAASLAILAALKSMRLPHVDVNVAADGRIAVEVDPRKPFVGRKGRKIVAPTTKVSESALPTEMPPVRCEDVSVFVAAALINSHFAVDPTLAEELALPAGILVGVSTAQQTGSSSSGSVTLVQQSTRVAGPSARQPLVNSNSSITSGKDMLSLCQDCLAVGSDIVHSMEIQLAEQAIQAAAFSH